MICADHGYTFFNREEGGGAEKAGVERLAAGCDVSMECDGPKGWSRSTARCEWNLSTVGVNVRNLRNPGVLRAER